MLFRLLTPAKAVILADSCCAFQNLMEDYSRIALHPTVVNTCCATGKLWLDRNSLVDSSPSRHQWNGVCRLACSTCTWQRQSCHPTAMLLWNLSALLQHFPIATSQITDNIEYFSVPYHNFTRVVHSLIYCLYLTVCTRVTLHEIYRAADRCWTLCDAVRYPIREISNTSKQKLVVTILKVDNILHFGS